MAKIKEEIIKEEMMTENAPEKAAPEKPAKPVKYRLKALMNVRKKPSLDAEKLGTKTAGTIVTVVSSRKTSMEVGTNA